MDTALATATMAATRAPTTALDEIGIGSRIDDFDLLTDLGAGAFARVYLARQRSMQRLVAVKISADHGTEPQTLAHLDHDYIVRVFDQRRVAQGPVNTANTVKLMYMQYVPGGTLRGVLRRVRDTEPALRNGRLLLSAVDGELLDRGGIRPVESRTRADIAALSWPETVAWLGRRLADALDYADRRGVLHRDLKPANVLLTADGAPKLADFNISYAHHVPGANPVAYFGGSLAYMSPEQLEAARPGSRRAAADLDTRSDLYALGMMLWELLTGRRPFDDAALFRVAGASTRVAMPGGDALDELLALRRRPIEQRFLDDLPDDCPATLRRVLLRCLRPDRDDRPANGREVAAQFDLCLDARARDLVDPPPRGWRARLAPWSLPITTLAGAIGNVAAIAYNKVHNSALTDSTLTAAEHARIHPIGEFLNWPFSDRVRADAVPVPPTAAGAVRAAPRPPLQPADAGPHPRRRARHRRPGRADRVHRMGRRGDVVRHRPGPGHRRAHRPADPRTHVAAGVRGDLGVVSVLPDDPLVHALRLPTAAAGGTCHRGGRATAAIGSPAARPCTSRSPRRCR